MIKKRVPAFFLALAMLLSLCPLSALAAEGETAQESTVALTEEECAEYNELLEYQLMRMLTGEEDEPGLYSTGGNTAGKKLSGDNLKVYEAVAAKLTGENGIAAKGGYTEFAVEGVTSSNNVDREKVFSALCFDYPYEMYWRGLSYGSATVNGTYYFYIQVSTDYRAGTEESVDHVNNAPLGKVNFEGGFDHSLYYVSPSKAQVVSQMITNAQGNACTILSEAQNITSDFGKLNHFKKSICDLVTYNDEAAGWTDDKYGDPWQLVYVFDEDNTTDVVCEGYSKAFQYLCDMTEFENNQIQCYTVSGFMGTGGHMWNIVTMEDGENYMADITNSDEGSYGQSGGLFLSGAEGSIDKGYTFLGTLYTYKDRTKAVYGTGTDSILNLASEDYKDQTAPASIELSYEPTSLVNSNGNISVPTITTLGTPTSKQITYTATVKGSDEQEITGRAVEWVLTGNSEGITLTPVSDNPNQAVLEISNSALPKYDNGWGTNVTVTASCSTTRASQKHLVYVSTRGAQFIHILKNGTDVASDSINTGGTVVYTAKVYDQYGVEMDGRVVSVNKKGTQGENAQIDWANMTVPEITWTSNNTNVATVNNGTVTAVAAGSATITASAGTEANAPSASVEVTVSQTEPVTKALTDGMVTLDSAGLTYTGAEIEPAVTVKDGNKTLVQDTDYTVAYSKNKDAGTEASVTITGIGSYTGTVTKKFEIKPVELTITAATVASKTVGDNTTATVTGVTFNGLVNNETLTLGTDYTATGTYSDTASAGEKNVNVTVTLKNTDRAKNYTISDSPYTAKGTVNTAGAHQLTVPQAQTLTYGEERTATATSSTGGAITYVSNAEDVVTVDNTGKLTAKKVGSATITVTVASSGAYTEATGTFTVTVNAKALSGTMVTLEGATGLTYTGETQMVTVKVTDSAATITENDYTISGNSGTNAGTYTVTVTGKDNYTDTDEKTFEIGKATPTVEVNPTSVSVRVGKTDTFTVTVKGVKNETPTGTVSAASDDTSIAAVSGTGSSFTVEGKQAGTVTVTVTYPGDTNYSKATANVAVTVNAKSAQTVTITGQAAGKVYGDGDFTISATASAETGVVTGAISYASSNESAATIDQNGKIHIAGVGKTTITATAAATDDCEAGTASFELTVTPKSIAGAAVTVEGTHTYTGSALTPTVTVKDGEKVLTLNTDYTVAYSGNKDAGTATVTVTGKGNYTGTKTASFTITPKAPAAQSVETNLQAADGKTAQIDLTKLIPTDNGGGTITYTAESNPTNATAAIADGKLTLTYQPTGGGEEVPEDQTITVKVDGMKNYSALTITVTIKYTSKEVVTLTITPSASLTYDGTEKGVTVTSDPAYDGEYVYLYTKEGAAEGSPDAPKNAGTYQVKVSIPDSNETYAGTSEIVFTIAPKAVTVTGKTLTVKAGAAAPASLYDITGLVEGETLDPLPTVECTYTASSPAGEYPITVTGAAASTDGNYSITYTNGTLTVTAVTPGKTATPTASPNGGSFTGSTSVTLSCATEGAVIYYTTDGSAPTTDSTRYSTPITLTATTTIKAIAVKDGMDDSEVLSVTFTRRSSGGGSGSGGSSSGGSSGSGTSSKPSTPPVDTDTSTGNGASATETTARPAATTKDGTATAAVSSTVGEEIVAQAVENESGAVVIAPEIEGSVTKTEVTIPASTMEQLGSKTSASLTVSTPVADVTIPNGALGALSEAGRNVKVTAERTGDTVELSIKAGNKTVDSVPGGVRVTVPVEEPTPGTVAVLVREDGTRQVIRKSTAGEDGVTIPLDGSAKIEIVDNSKSFADVPATNWASDAVAFASSHELFNGTSSGQFSPNLPMSRGMLAVVLHNLESNPTQAFTGVFADVDRSEWYAEGVSWAAGRGIINGYNGGLFGPSDNITREQLAVMLWRYAGSPTAAGGALNFTDADKVSSWARDAMLWATEKGILNGKGGGVLDPAGNATRAETAQMLKNFMET